MNDELVADLTERFLCGRSTAKEQTALWELVSASPEAKNALAAQVRMSVLLEALWRPGSEAESRRRIEMAVAVAERPAILTRGDIARKARASWLPRWVPAVPQAGAYGWGITALAASVLVALGLLVAASLERSVLQPVPVPVLARVKRAHGDSVLWRRGLSLPVPVGQSLTVSDKLSTGAAGGAFVVCSNGSTLELGPQTAVRFESTQAATPVAHVDVGKVAARVLTRPRERPMIFATPHAEVVVVGTCLNLDVQPARTRVELTEGRLQVRNLHTGKTVDLSESQFAEVGPETIVGSLTKVGPAAKAPGAAPLPPPAPRIPDGLQVLYAFAENGGTVVRDTSGVGQPLDLRIEDRTAVRWLSGGGLAVLKPTIAISEGPARKLIAACRASNEISIEAWLSPRQAVHGREWDGAATSRIVSLSADWRARNFTLAQIGGFYGLRLRTSTTSMSGTRVADWTPHESQYSVHASAMVSTGPVRLGLTHLVATRDASGRARLFVNGAEAAVETVPGDFSNWADDHALMLARETVEERPGAEPRYWLGEYHRVAIYSRALTAPEVQSGFRAGARPGPSG